MLEARLDLHPGNAVSSGRSGPTQMSRTLLHTDLVNAGISGNELLGPNPPDVALLLMSLRPGRNISCSHLDSPGRECNWGSPPYAMSRCAKVRRYTVTVQNPVSPNHANCDTSSHAGTDPCCRLKSKRPSAPWNPWNVPTLIENLTTAWCKLLTVTSVTVRAECAHGDIFRTNCSFRTRTVFIHVALLCMSVFRRNKQRPGSA